MLYCHRGLSGTSNSPVPHHLRVYVLEREAWGKLARSWHMNIVIWEAAEMGAPISAVGEMKGLIIIKFSQILRHIIRVMRAWHK